MIPIQRIGRHIVRVEGDILFAAPKGEMKLAELQTLLTFFEETLRSCPQTYAIFDVTEAVAFGPDLRKKYNQWALKWQFAGMTFYGASLMVRTVVGMVMRATALFKGGQLQPMVFCKTEEESRRWIDDLRRQQSPSADSRRSAPNDPR